jgi:hypothetical protein
MLIYPLYLCRVPILRVTSQTCRGDFWSKKPGSWAGRDNLLCLICIEALDRTLRKHRSTIRPAIDRVKLSHPSLRCLTNVYLTRCCRLQAIQLAW